MPLFLIYLFLSYSMKTWADVYIVLACWRGLDASWSRIEVGLLVVCLDCVGFLRSKSVEKLPNFPPAGLEPTLLQKVLKMKPSSGKLQFWEGEKTLLLPEHFVPRPYWYFTFLHAGNVFRHGGMLNNSIGEEHFVPRPCWYFTFLHAGNVRGGLNVLCFVSYCTR